MDRPWTTGPKHAAQPAAGTTPQAERQQSHQQITNPFIEAVLGQGRAVATVETPTDIPTHFVKWEDAKKGEDGVYRVATVETRLTAEQFVAERLERDPNEPDEEDAWQLRFPNAVEAVTGRDFWVKHLAQLLEAFRDKSDNEEIKRLALALSERPTRDEFSTVKSVNAGLREEIERLSAALDGKVENSGSIVGRRIKHYRERAEAAEAEAAALRKQQESWRKGTESNMKSMAKLAENLKEELGEALREAAALREALRGILPYIEKRGNAAKLLAVGKAEALSAAPECP